MTISAPYNFIPLSKSIFLPPWSRALAHDMPFGRGLSGSLDYVITAHTPLLVSAGREPDPQGQSPASCSFFRLPDGRYAIPGSSMRGMTRNVLEIASFARMRLVDDRRYGLRDLTNTAVIDYRNHMTVQIENAHAPKTRAGWLYFSKGAWRIQEVDFARLDHDQLGVLTAPNATFHTAFLNIQAAQAQSDRDAPTIYNAWDASIGADGLVRDFDVEINRKTQPHNGLRLYYKRARAPIGPAAPPGYVRTTGTLVFTGQPSRVLPGRQRPHIKHMEFVFLDPINAGASITTISDRVWQGFTDVHENGEKASATWNFWLQRYQSGTAEVIPVFFLLDRQEKVVESLGLAMMYKKAHKHTVHGLVRHTKADHVTPHPGELPDLAELIFGRVGDTPAGTLKGRVSFGLAALEPQQDVREDTHSVVFSSPKPSYFPSYVRQTDFLADTGLELFSGEIEHNGRTRNARAEYKSYMDDDAEIRGWKRYHARHSANPAEAAPPPNSTISIASQTIIHPIRSADAARPLRFRGTLRFHNLLPEELGALIWALTWGGNANLRHGLGMGKSVGLGNVSIALENVSLVANDSRVQLPSLDACRSAYEGMMEAWSARSSTGPRTAWSTTIQLRALTAMADPDRSTVLELRHMRIDPNEFVAAKNASQVLREPPGLAPPRREKDPRRMKIRR